MDGTDTTSISSAAPSRDFGIGQDRPPTHLAIGSMERNARRYCEMTLQAPPRHVMHRHRSAANHLL
jgi:hypothetical protein